MPADARWLLCDLDGTLADSLGALRAAYEAFLRGHGRQGSDGEFARLNGPALREVVALLVEWHGLAIPVAEAYAGYIDKLRSEYRERVAPAAGAVRLLEVLAGEGWNLALVTSAPRAVAREFLNAQQWSEKFSVIVCGDEAARGKPAPDLYDKALVQAAADPGRCIVLEDSSNGIAAARAAGLEVLRVHADRPPSGVPVVGDLIEALAWLRKWPPSHDRILAGPVSVRWRSGSDHRDESASAAIAAIWNDERLRRPELRDDPLLCVESWERTASGVLAIQSVFRPYRSYLARRRRPDLNLGFAPLAVSMVTCVGGEVVVARRSQRVTAYPGLLEFIPAGGLDKDCARSDGHVDYQDQALRELTEEAGGGFRIISVITAGLLHDLEEDAWDIIGVMQVEPPWRPQPTSECPEVRLLTPAACAQSLTENPGDWVPTAPSTWKLVEQHLGKEAS